ncbi:MAG: ATPase domain-containing protein [Methanosarcinales archaeon]|nr:circadian clock protein KaiC [ANME-2 cluster archaeon]MDF1531740.1 ATPase domain-containing protein [ANME-2 cluster archaeon]MDW7776640.1 ATPase domain-containing protein [Methanosarcinales archaeon]
MDGHVTNLSDPDVRVPTGVEGFDELCGGGFIKDRTYLISGTSGAGKTIFTLQFLYNGITKYGENGIFVATEERPEQIRENGMMFGWDFKKLEDEGRLAIIDAASTKIGIPSQEKYVDVRPFDMRSMMDQIIMIQEEIDAKRAVVDSTTSIGFYLQDPAKIRVELLKLSTTLEILGLTSLMTSEIVDDDHPSRFGVENFVTEGTIALYYKRMENVRVRSMEVYKMRGSDHSKKIHPYDITSSGIVVHPHEEVYTVF